MNKILIFRVKKIKKNICKFYLKLAKYFKLYRNITEKSYDDVFNYKILVMIIFIKTNKTIFDMPKESSLKRTLQNARKKAESLLSPLFYIS